MTIQEILADGRETGDRGENSRREGAERGRTGSEGREEKRDSVNTCQSERPLADANTATCQFVRHRLLVLAETAHARGDEVQQDDKCR